MVGVWEAAGARLVAPALAIGAAIATMFAFLLLLSVFVLLHNGNPIQLLWGAGNPLANAMDSLPMHLLPMRKRQG